jgi:hypothetical protein
MHVDVAFDVDEPMMERVDLRDERRQRLEVRPLGGEELARTRMQMIFIGGVDFVAPRPGLRIEIGEVGKCPPGEKIGLDEPEGALDAARSVASPFSWARTVKWKRSAKAAISGAGTIRAPVPEATTTCVLSIMQVVQAPVRYASASVRKTLQVNRVKAGYIWMKSLRE